MSDERCDGSAEFVAFGNKGLPLGHAICPQCGRSIAFHNITGRLARHSRPSAPVAEQEKP